LIFRSLGWVPNEAVNNCTILARACIEGWFPPEKWGELNQQYAGLGQLLRNKDTAVAFMKHAWKHSEDPDHPFTNEDYVRLEEIAHTCYNVKTMEI
jgi:hypothetical protein